MSFDDDGGSSSTYSSEASSSDSDSESSNGAMFIVEKIMAHHSYGHLKLRGMIDSSRPQADWDLFFLVRWEGYASTDDSWEPLDTVESLDVFRKYCKKNGDDLRAFRERAKKTFGCKNSDEKEKRLKHHKSSDTIRRDRYTSGSDDESSVSRDRREPSARIESSSISLKRKKSGEEERLKKRKLSEDLEDRMRHRQDALQKLVEKRRRSDENKRFEKEIDALFTEDAGVMKQSENRVGMARPKDKRDETKRSKDRDTAVRKSKEVERKKKLKKTDNLNRKQGYAIGISRTTSAGERDISRPRKIVDHDRISVGHDRISVGNDRGPDRISVGNDRRPDRKPLGHDRIPVGPDRKPLGHDRIPVGPDRRPVGHDRRPDHEDPRHIARTFSDGRIEKSAEKRRYRMDNERSKDQPRRIKDHRQSDGSKDRPSRPEKSSFDDLVQQKKRQPLRIIVSSDEEPDMPFKKAPMVTPTSEREEVPPMKISLTSPGITSLPSIAPKISQIYPKISQGPQISPKIPAEYPSPTLSTRSLSESTKSKETKEKKSKPKLVKPSTSVDRPESDEDSQMCIELGCMDTEEAGVKETPLEDQSEPCARYRTEYMEGLTSMEDEMDSFDKCACSTSLTANAFVQRDQMSPAIKRESEESTESRWKFSKIAPPPVRSETNVVPQRHTESNKHALSRSLSLPFKQGHSVAERVSTSSNDTVEDFNPERDETSDGFIERKSELRRSLMAAHRRDFMAHWNYLKCDMLNNDLSNDTIDWIFTEVCMRDANDISPLGDILHRVSCSRDHDVCKLLIHILSLVSVGLRQRLFEELRDRNGNAPLAQTISMAVAGNEPCVIDALLQLGASINSGRISALQKCVDSGYGGLVVHLLRKGADFSRLKCFESADLCHRGAVGASQTTNPLVWHLMQYVDRFNATLEEWTSPILKRSLPSDLKCLPVSTTHPYRVQQLDRRVLMRVAPRDPFETVSAAQTYASANRITMLVIYMCKFSVACDLASLHPEKRVAFAELPSIIRVRLGAACEQVDLHMVMRTPSAIIYQFPKCFRLEPGTRVHVNLSYTQRNIEEDALLALRLWVAQAENC